jgi:hypothetical protein
LEIGKMKWAAALAPPVSFWEGRPEGTTAGGIAEFNF